MRNFYQGGGMRGLNNLKDLILKINFIFFKLKYSKFKKN